MSANAPRPRPAAASVERLGSRTVLGGRFTVRAHGRPLEGGDRPRFHVTVRVDDRISPGQFAFTARLEDLATIAETLAALARAVAPKRGSGGAP